MRYLRFVHGFKQYHSFLDEEVDGSSDIGHVLADMYITSVVDYNSHWSMAEVLSLL